MSWGAFLSRRFSGYRDSSTSSLQGLRTLACLGTMLVHVVAYGSLVLDHGQILRKVDENAFTFVKLIYNLFLPSMVASVDIFFFVSGFCFASSIERASDKNVDQKSNQGGISLRTSLKYLLNRWLRFLPVLLCISFLGKAAGIKPCVSWREIAFIDRPPFSYGSLLDTTNMCVMASWSLFVDFYAHAFMLLFLLLLPSKSEFIQILLGLVFLQPLLRAQYWLSVGMPLSVPSNFVHFLGVSESQIVAEQLGIQLGDYTKYPVQFEQQRNELFMYFPLYSNLEFRYATIFVGTLTWYAMKQNAYIVRVIRRNEKMSLGIVVLIWIFCMHASYLLDKDHSTSVSVFMVVYETMGRLGIAMATAVVTILTNTVEPEAQIMAEKGVLSKYLQMILSHPILAIPSQVTYPAYLLHLFVVPVTTFRLSPILTKENYSRMNILLSTLQLFVFVLVISIPLFIVERLSEPIRVWIVRALFSHKPRQHPHPVDTRGNAYLKKCQS